MQCRRVYVLLGLWRGPGGSGQANDDSRTSDPRAVDLGRVDSSDTRPCTSRSSGGEKVGARRVRSRFLDWVCVGVGCVLQGGSCR